MKRALIAACVLFLSICAHAQQHTVKVRLFWQHPPAKIHVEPVSAMMTSCATCKASLMQSPIDITPPTGTRIITGSARISGERFAPFRIEGPLTVESRNGVLLLTLAMPVEEYVVSVLAGESANFKSDEALKAMAVAARTYAVHFGSRHKLDGFDFCDTTHCQDVRLGSESTRVRAAVTATEGELLWFEGRPAATYYHRSCGGELDNATALDPNLRAPYLRRHQDPYCSRADEWHASIPLADLSRALSRSVSTVSIGARDESGRVTRLLINGRPISASDLRLAIGRTLGWDKVRSDLYEFQIENGSINVRGRGQGHGVGLCQTGADNMGQQGRMYRDILAFYYPGAVLGINAQGLRWQVFPGAGVDVITTNPNDVPVLLPAAETALRFALGRVGWTTDIRPRVKVFPTLAIYRDATGEPGWVAASTNGTMVRLQPLSTLQRTKALDSTLRHEFLHMVLESQANPKAPLSLREGLALYLENPNAITPRPANLNSLDARLRSAHTETNLRSAYRLCAAAVADLVQKHSRATVLDWLKHGVPAAVQ